MIFAIDPGTKQSGWVLLNRGKVEDAGVHDNHDLLRWVQAGQDADELAIEMMQGAYAGFRVGKEVFDTVRWVGRFQQVWRAPQDVMLISRDAAKAGLKIKRQTGPNKQSDDSLVREALIAMFGEQGTKRSPGPLYGVTSHALQALAVAVVASPKDAPAAFADSLFAAPQSKPAARAFSDVPF